MTQILINTLAVLTSLMIACAALANPKGGHNKGHNHGHHNGHNHGSSSPKFNGPHKGFSSAKKYQQQYGKSFSHGFYYPGRSHNHWTYSGYSPKFGCVCHWCPHTGSYYYWSPSAASYYPVSYLGFAAPEKFDPRFGGSPASPPFGVPPLPR